MQSVKARKIFLLPIAYYHRWMGLYLEDERFTIVIIIASNSTWYGIHVHDCERVMCISTLHKIQTKRKCLYFPHYYEMMRTHTITTIMRFIYCYYTYKFNFRFFLQFFVDFCYAFVQCKNICARIGFWIFFILLFFSFCLWEALKLTTSM